MKKDEHKILYFLKFSKIEFILHPYFIVLSILDNS
jgi:hypothetical protein